MKQYLKIFLILTSVVLITTSCAYKPVTYSNVFEKGNTEVQIFPSDSHDLILSTGNVEILNQSFNGYFAIKRISSQEYRINFSNEIGLTIFDFGLKPEELHIYNVLKNIDKPALINKIGLFFKVFLFHPEKDFSKELQLKSLPAGLEIKDRTKNEWLFFNDRGILQEKHRKSGLFGMKKIKIFYLQWGKGYPESILMEEGGFLKLKMKLKIIKLS